ncbi:MAG TPA: CehA/McbA family metallohydrolase [Gemmata sp.]|nr:CehA/McbA family metallohydrolase [Gemmata sp.]
MLNVHLRINDSIAGKPTPVRLRISTPEGKTFAPLGRSVEFPTGRNEAVGGHLKLGSERWCYIDGACEIPLPAGIPLRVQATKGPEYKPLDEMVTLGPGQLSLRFVIVREFNWRGLHYHPGDMRCHFLTPHAGLLEMMAEDLDIANALAIPFTVLALDGNAYTTTPDLLAFCGQQPALSAPSGHAFAVNTMNAHPVLGKMGLLHSHRAVFPLTFGEPDATDDWSICDWCDQCHRKGGLTVWVEAFERAGGLLGGEALVAAILGKIDALEIDPGPRSIPLLPWLYRLWNVGVWVPLVGGSGKDSNRTPLGAMRTYAHVTGEFSLREWIEAIRKGHTFVTSAPFVELEVNGRRHGETVDTDGAVTMTARAASLKHFEKLEIVANGEVIASAPEEMTQLGTWSVVLERECILDESSWVAARCVGKQGFAHTSPVKVRVKDQPPHRDEAAAAALRQLVKQICEWGKVHGQYSNEKRREQLLNRCALAMGRLGTLDRF